MATIAKDSGGKEYKLVEAGTKQAVCYDVWDIGIQESEFNGEKLVSHKVIIAFEVPDLVDEGEFKGKRMTINKWFTLSLHEKSNLRPFLESWRGKSFTENELKGFDVEKLIGVNCMLSIVHSKSRKGKSFANINNASKLMAGLTPMIPENKRSVPDWIEKLREKAVTPDNGSSETDSTEPYEETPF